uniref:Uncharacterized protein n=1 Tax=Setaria italica TaxID=4555 RepID=K3Y825_SETIT
MTSAGVTALCCSHALTRIPALRYLHTSSATNGWSECMGQASIGLPWLRLSMAEFQPQWLMNAAVAPCARISSCGAHVVITSPMPWVCSVNSDRNLACRLSIASSSCTTPRSASRRTHTNRCLLSRNAAASSATCSAINDDVVPNDTYSTDAFGCLSSQLRHSGRVCRALAVTLGPNDELEELPRHARGRWRRVVEPARAQEPLPGVRPRGVVGRGDALQAVRLGVGEYPRRLGRGEGAEAVVQDDDAAGARGEAREEAGDRAARARDEGVAHGDEVGRERRGRGRVRRRGGVRGDGDLELVEADAAEGVVAPAVHARARLADVRPRRREVHGEPPRRELQRQVQHPVEVALRRERHRYDGNGFHGGLRLGRQSLML